MSYESIEEMYAELFINAGIIIEALAQDVKNFLIDYIDENLYQASRPEEYFRTRDFINAVVVTDIKQFKNSWSITITYDTTRIIPIERANTWNAHRAFRKKRGKQGKDVSHWIPEILELGNAPNRIYEHKGIFATERVTILKFDEVIAKAVLELRNLGYDITYIRK